jgi:hypothetical protein
MIPALQDKACDMYARIKGAMGPDAALEAGAEGIRNAVMPETSAIASLGAVANMNPLNMPVREAGVWPDPREVVTATELGCLLVPITNNLAQTNGNVDWLAGAMTSLVTNVNNSFVVLRDTQKTMQSVQEMKNDEMMEKIDENARKLRELSAENKKLKKMDAIKNKEIKNIKRKLVDAQKRDIEFDSNHARNIDEIDGFLHNLAECMRANPNLIPEGIVIPPAGCYHDDDNGNPRRKGAKKTKGF